MTKELYVVYFESANYAGAGEYCLVWATDDENARDEAIPYAEEFYRDQDESQYFEEYGEDDGVVWASIMEAYPLASEEGADIRGYLEDESQKQFYPIVN